MPSISAAFTWTPPARSSATHVMAIEILAPRLEVEPFAEIGQRRDPATSWIRGPGFRRRVCPRPARICAGRESGNTVGDCFERDRALDDVLELADVARPAVCLAAARSPRRDAVAPACRIRSRVLRRKCSASSGMSSRRSRSGGSRDRNHVEAVEEVLAEPSLGHHLLRGRWLVAAITRTSTCTSRAADALERAVLQDAQQLHLHRRVISPISSRKMVPPSASSNSPFLFAVAPVKRPAHVAEQLGLEQRLGQRRRSSPRRTDVRGAAIVVDRARHQLLARARLAGDHCAGSTA